MLLEIARRDVRHGHRRSGFPLWVLAALDAGDGLGRLAPRLVGGDHPMAPERDPLRLALRPGLNHVHLRPGGIHPDPEAGQLPIPEHGVLLVNGEPVDGAFGNGSILELGHRAPPDLRFFRPLRRTVSVSAAQATGVQLGRIVGCQRRQVASKSLTYVPPTSTPTRNRGDWSFCFTNSGAGEALEGVRREAVRQCP